MLFANHRRQVFSRRGPIITLDTKVGVKTLFTESEEKLLADHVKHMASIGYGYNKSGIQYMARHRAISLIKSVKHKDSLGNFMVL